MDSLVFGISAINFHHCTDENCAPNHLPSTSKAAMANTATDSVIDFNHLPPASIAPFEILANNVGNKNHTTDTADETFPSSSKGTTNRRYLPPRATRPNNLFQKTQRRSIVKHVQRPTKKTCGDFSTLTAKDIKKIYLNKKLTNFHPSKLETIFEEPSPDSSNAGRNQVQFVGTRKLKRSLLLSDGFNANKTLIKQRRQKIKKAFGRRYALKKINLEDFLQHLDNNMNSSDSDESEIVKNKAVADAESK